MHTTKRLPSARIRHRLAAIVTGLGLTLAATPMVAQTTVTFEETAFLPQNADFAGRFFYRGTTWLGGDAVGDQGACLPASCLSSLPKGFKPRVTGGRAFAQMAFDAPSKNVRFFFAAAAGASGEVRAFGFGSSTPILRTALTPETNGDSRVFVAFGSIEIVYMEFEGAGSLFIDDFRFSPTTNSQISFSRSTYTTAEGSSVNVEVLRSGEGPAVSADVAVVGGSASESEDYSLSTRTIRFPAGTGGTQSLRVDALSDAALESVETIKLELRNVQGATVGTGAATVRLLDRPAVDSAKFTESLWVGKEGDSIAVQIDRAVAIGSPLTIDVVAEPLSGSVPGDSSLSSSSLSWTADEVGTKSIELVLSDDELKERTELVLLRIVPTENSVDRFQDADHSMVVIQDDDRDVPCRDDPLALCLADERFRVFAEWRLERDGSRGIATPIPATTDSGLFWFFQPTNTELVVKVLDGRAITNAFWLFYGALSDVRYWVVVEDEITGAVKLYENPSGNLCGIADTQAFPVSPGVTSSQTASRIPSRLQRSTIGLGSSCIENRETLCIEGGRYSVTAERIDNDLGIFVPAEVFSRASDSGIFWFFDPSNLELAVKLLNGSGINGHEWFFYGALSDVEYRITVTDHTTGESVTYFNPDGEICGLGDIEALLRE